MWLHVVPADLCPPPHVSWQLVVFRKKQYYCMKENHLNLVGSSRFAELKSRMCSELKPLHQRLRRLHLLAKSAASASNTTLADIKTRMTLLEDECQR